MPYPKYFQDFPTETVKIFDTERTITDLSVRPRVKPIVLLQGFPFYDYIIKDGERPDHVAFKHYGDSKYFWLIMITNEIYDLWRDWPLDQEAFDKSMVDRYGSVSAAKSTIVKYFNTVDNIEIDLPTYQSLLSSERSTKNAYEIHQEENEAKRRIRIIQKRYLAQAQTELKELFEA